ncbi:MAG TPA: hypothetical protein VFP37_00840 [Steroidobacteraceae bacterium]|nr:hypothetical protein [Steroidobacteraceae bacterium]
MSAKNLMTSPVPYGIWALAVVAALVGTYFGDPYVFGFTTFGLCWLTIALAIVGVGICVFSKRLRARDRVLIVAALAVAAVAIAQAFRMLAGFNWA